SSLIGVVSQRLVRRPCPACAQPTQPTAETADRAGAYSRLPVDARWVAGRGCEECAQSGYKGRLAIHEILHVNEEVRELISGRASEQAIRKAARQAGMRTLVEDGIAKAAEGLTTLDEVFRVVSRTDSRDGEPEGRTVKTSPLQAGPPTS